MNQQYTYLLLLNCLWYLLLPLVTVNPWWVRQQYVKNTALRKIDCKCMLNVTNDNSIHCYGNYFCVLVVSEVNFQISRVILLGNEQLDQEHFLQCQHNLVTKLNSVSLQLVKEQSCSLFHAPDNK